MLKSTECCFEGTRLHSVDPDWSRTPRVRSFGRSTNDLQQEEEDLNDVDVEGERCKHVLLRADGVLPVPQQQLSVVRQELRDDQQTLRTTPRPNTTAVKIQMTWYKTLTNVKAMAPIAAYSM